MNWFTLRGRACRASGSVRRRTGRFVPPTIESLEGRRLLAAGNFGINVAISPYASFVNLLQTPGTWGDAPGDTNTIVLNASGDPESDASLLFDLRVNQPFNGPDPNAVPPPLNGTYNLTFNGEATIQTEYPGFSTAFTVQNQVYNASTNTTTAQLVVPTSNTSDFFGISFLNTQATATSAINTGFSNAKLIRPGYAANSTQLYTNQFLSALAPFSTIRYLEPDNANGQPILNGNTLVTVNSSQVDQTGTPWEYLIALANQTNTDMWINIPQGATNDYITALAGIIKNGGTVNGVAYAGLNSNLKVYLEYSNEVWGGIPNNLTYQEDAVQNSASNQPLSTFPGNLDVYTNVDGSSTTNVYTAAGRRYLEETADISQIFQSVLGSDPTHQRIRPVLGWQEDNFSFYPGALAWYEHFFGSASAAFYGMGDANYFNPTDYTSVSSVLSTLQSQETAYAIPDTTDFTVLATYYGLANVSYEGGPSIGADGTTSAGQNALAASRSAAMEQIVLQHYEDFYAAGGTLAMYFDGPFDTWTPQNEWGAAELAQTGNPTAAAKYRGTVDVAAASPVAVTAGTAVSATGTTSLNVSTDSLGTSFVVPQTGQQDYWLVKAASTGSYDLKLTTAFGNGVAPGQVQVYVNDKAVGGPISVAAPAVVDLGNLSLSAGLNTVSLLMVHAAFDPSQSNNSYYQFNPTSLTLTALGSGSGSVPTVGDAGFEQVNVGAGGFATNPTGSAWTFSTSSGISGNNSAITSGNPPAPQGSQVAFLRGYSSITQAITTWAAGTYTISFDAAQAASSAGVQAFAVLVDGIIVGTFQPTTTAYQVDTTGGFTVAAGSHTIQFLGLDGGNVTDLLDAVSVAAVAVQPGPAVGDFSFEQVVVGAGHYAYNPSGSAWTFSAPAGTSGSGVSGIGSGFTGASSPPPQGAQVAFLEGVGTINQTVSGWSAGTYAISFDAALRGNFGHQAESFEVLVDGNVEGTFQPSNAAYLPYASSIYQAYTTSSFTVSAGVHTIEFLGVDPTLADYTDLIDNVTIASYATPAVPTVGDAGFEQVNVGAGGFATNPTGSAWTFSTSSGISGNGSAITSGNPVAPQGSQVAFLRGYSSITQAITTWAAGTYTISFDAAQAASSAGVQAFAVLVDGIIVGTFQPTTTAYQVDTTGGFTVAAGTHTIQFLGLDGGNVTDLLDAVSVAAVAVQPGPAVGDYSFEQVVVGAGHYAYNPSGSAWTFSASAGTSGSGVSGIGSGFTGASSPPPQGAQVAFLEGVGTISQTVSGWSAGTYAISFDAALRGDLANQAESFEVLVDGNVEGTFQPSNAAYQAYASSIYQAYTTSSFTVSAGVHTIEFLGVDPTKADYTDLIDDVTII